MTTTTNTDRAYWARAAITAAQNTPATPPQPGPATGSAIVAAYAALTRHNPREHLIADADHARELISDIVGDLCHLADELGTGSTALIRAHADNGDPGIPQDLLPLVRALNSVLTLAAAYGIDGTALVADAVARYREEAAEELDPDDE